ncbi:MAG: hypothetical protein RLZZ293_504 [Pseudomonadota bacterium]|jgi:SAM-dependent methyltransferase
MNLELVAGLQDWLLSDPLGREILAKQRLFLATQVTDYYGNYSLQIGLSQINLLQGNKIKHHFTLGSDLLANLAHLPIQSSSVDLIICPYALEFYQNYDLILAELYRILAPNGKLIFLCFNRYSWLGLKQIRLTNFKDLYLIDLVKFKQQLAKLNLTINAGKFFNYCPPCKTTAQLRRWSWLNKVGDRWIPTWANSFILIVSKQLPSQDLLTNNLEQLMLAT